MDVEQQQQQDDVSTWFSTYGLITAQRVLGRYQIELPDQLLMEAVKNRKSIYHRILQVPLKNVLNGIVQQQAYDYHVYAQKLYIDYLLSAESASPDTAPGASTREALEEERLQLIALGESFHELQLEHGNLIAASQRLLIDTTHQWNIAMEEALRELQVLIKTVNTDIKPSQVRNALNYALSRCQVHDPLTNALDEHFIGKMNEPLKIAQISTLKPRITEILATMVAVSTEFETNLQGFYESAQTMHEQSKAYRTQFYDTIIRVLELIKLLPDYKIDPVQDEINREPLLFDKTIGENW